MTTILKINPTFKMPSVSPIFKWTGRKTRLLAKYEAVGFFPDASEFDTFIDLFAGSGAVTCWVAERYAGKKLMLNDSNVEMMGMFFELRDNWEEFRDEYLKVTSHFIETPQDERKALYNFYKCRHAYDYRQLSGAEMNATLLAMMKINFNGMWKNYKKYDGRYSTPPGLVNYNERVFDLDKVEAFKDMLLGATLFCGSFEEVPVPEKSWIYADPPYRDCSVGYANEFNDDAQDALARFLTESGCLYAESNKEVGDGFWTARFPEENIHYLDNKYTCGHGASVVPVTEVLIKNY
jgi:DNA adenine methylase Dam